LQDALQQAFGQHPNIGDIRGRGLFRGIEFVEDRDSKRPFAPEKALAAKLKKESFAAGLVCYPMAGTIDGRQGDHILLAPPFIMEDQHIDEIITKLKTAIDRAL
jgi:adenosylmethionine-8-amino-7-oxononanoate aminotransferase